MIQKKCMLKMAGQYVTPKLELTNKIEEAVVIEGKRKAKKLQRFIQKQTKHKVECIVCVE